MRETRFRKYDKTNNIWIIMDLNSIGYNGEQGWDDESVGQYTGLKDKNGKEIYEGDIIKNNRYECLSEVIWKQTEVCKAGIVKGVFGEDGDLGGFIFEIGGFGFGGVGKYKDKIKVHYIGEFEIVGNIYENPELIK